VVTLLSETELILIAWYRWLSRLQQMAIRYWLTTGDIDLVLWLGIFGSDAHQIAQIASAEG